ncbi:MAG: AmmeMemoRadiSam system protein A [Syntrophorhabdaceae bacterium]|nr:AmmeMemoRadiSam system protein A [Syntrophorhabdaceae bacterium]
MALTQKDKDFLKKLARDAIEARLFNKELEKREIPENLKQYQGAFVTIKKKGELRGCIGYIKGYLPLYETVEQVAVQAAFHDPRFDALSKEEFKDIDIEISVLSPLKKIENIEEIEVGTHGIYIEKGFHSGLLLPQVATENAWDRKTFLEHSCYKAGLHKDAYKEKDTNIYIFSAEVF